MANESQTQYPNYATERSHWHLKSGTEPNAMDSLFADWFSAGRDALSAQHSAFVSGSAGVNLHFEGLQ